MILYNSENETWLPTETGLPNITEIVPPLTYGLDPPLLMHDKIPQCMQTFIVPIRKR